MYFFFGYIAFSVVFNAITSIDITIACPIQYTTDIIHGTRNDPSLFLGASPRASLNILMAAKTMAAIQGRDFIVPEDIKEVAYPVLNHRVTLTPEKEMDLHNLGLFKRDTVFRPIKWYRFIPPTCK